MNHRFLTGISVGKLEVKLGGTLSDELMVKFHKNGKRYYKIGESLDSEIYQKTNVKEIPYSDIESLKENIKQIAKKVYHVPFNKYLKGYMFSWQQPKIEVEYLNNRELGKRDQERAIKNNGYKKRTTLDEIENRVA